MEIDNLLWYNVFRFTLELLAAGLIMARLTAIRGPHKGAFYDLEHPETVIGRLRTCSICLHDAAVGRQHAKIILRGENASVVDLKSKAGIYVNGRKVVSAKLADGDVIRIGNSTFSFSTDRSGPRTTEEMVVLASLKAEETDRARLALSRQAASEKGELAFLYEVADSLLPETQSERLLQTILDLLSRRFQPAGAHIFLVNSNTKELELHASRSDSEVPPISRTMVGQSYDNRESLLVQNAHADPRFSDAQSVRLYQIRSAVCVPLGRLGVINLCHTSTRRSFTHTDLTSLSIIAALASPALEKALHLETVEQKVQELTSIVKGQYNIVGKSAAIRNVFELIGRAAKTNSTVLILGESGTGKELVARALHFNSERSGRPFVAVNCASLAESLVESELFGHEKGAFTGAVEARPGKFEQADGGTLFLDEIGELRPAVQAKLLRVLEDGVVQRIGSVKDRKVNVRLLAASNRDLRADAARGIFRQDLLYRLEVIQIPIPPLRRRVEDIPMLIEHFIEMFRNKSNRWVRGVSDEALHSMKSYSWPGNVRELKNVIERCMVLGRHDRIEKEDVLQFGLSEFVAPHAQPTRTLSEIEREHIMNVLRQCGGRKGEAAKLLGIDRKTLFRKLESFGSEQNI